MAARNFRQMSSSEEVHQMMVDRMKAERDEATRLSRARKEGKAEGIAEGEAKGRAEGEAKGRVEGEAKGRAEGKAEAERAMIKSLLARGMSPDDIYRMLDLTPDQLP